MKFAKKGMVTLTIIFFLCNLIPVTADCAGITAHPTNSVVYINENKVSFTAYTIGGNNYFKLRDLAASLNGTNKQFSVEWNNAKNTVSLQTEKSYTKVGGELKPNNSTASKSAVPTTANLFCNDIRLVYQAYSIDGNYYYKLRDIMQILNISVDWNGATNSILMDTTKPYVYDSGLLKGTTLPPLKLVGNWPMPQKDLQTMWARCYPQYVLTFGMPTKILTQGITWIWNDSITNGDDVSWNVQTNSVNMGPLPHHNNFDPNNHENYEPLYMQMMHETGHMFWQEGDENLNFDFGQWIWEANSLIGESMYDYRYFGEPQNIRLFTYDLAANLGHNAVNGVITDCNKYGSAGRTMVDESATQAFAVLESVLSYDTGYNYFAQVNALRVADFIKTGNIRISAETYGTMLDQAANGRTVDGKKPSEWLFSQPVANNNGALGVFMTVISDPIVINPRFTARINTALFRRSLNDNGDKVEKSIVGTNIDLRLYDCFGKLIENTSQPSSDNGNQISMQMPDNLTAGAYRITASATVDGNAVASISYVYYYPSGDYGACKDNQMAFILLNPDGTIKTNTTGLSFTNVTNTDTSLIGKGLVVVTANEGANVNVKYGGKTYIYSKPFTARIIPLVLN